MGVTVLDPYKALDASSIETWLTHGDMIQRDYSRSTDQSLGYIQEIWSVPNKRDFILPEKIALQ